MRKMLPHQPRQWASLPDLLHLPLHYGTNACQSKQKHVQDLDMVSYDIEEMETDGRNAKVDLESKQSELKPGSDCCHQRRHFLTMSHDECLAIPSLPCHSDTVRSLVSEFLLFCFVIFLMTQRFRVVSDSCVLEIETEIMILN